ncbi:MAG: FAD-dependent monooxygenase [Hyphomicrobiales bacterium]|nr:FAD-dependent monooxygenase [Hyphomicrobiales bacterium]
MSNGSTTSVIIVGAGPVGLGLACDLGQRGVDCILIEKRDGAITVPKQSMVSARNMEFCRRWGIANKVRTAVWPEHHARDFVYLESMRGKELLRFRVPSYAERDRRDFTPEPACPCPQIYFDPILGDYVRQSPSVTLAYNTRLEEFRQDRDGVTARVTDMVSGTARALRARYLVGCDGPSGMVRDALGIDVKGIGAIAHSVNLFFRSPELSDSHDKGWARFYRVVDETGCWGELIPIDGKELWRLTVFDAPLSRAEPDELLRKLAGGPFAYEMISVSPWERRDYVARSYGNGRVFIAGDSAHECSPTGGIGMHTGLEEAVNLGWKLAATIAGWGGPSLLASYEIERRPIAQRNVSLATRSFHAIAAIPPWRAGLTEWTTDPAWLSIPEHVKLHYCYENSPVCVADGTPPFALEPARFEPSTRPGTRAPHAWLADDRSTLDLFGDGFALLRLGTKAPDATPLLAAARARNVPMREIGLADPEVSKLYERRWVLVRPDGHVAWRGDAMPADAATIVERVRGAGADAAALVGSEAPAQAAQSLS